jgi:predicted esterase
MLGCGALVMLTCGIGGIGGVAWLMTRATPPAASRTVPVVVEVDKPAKDVETEEELPSGSLPERPLQLLAPLPPASNIGQTDLTKLDPRVLRATAHQFYEKGQYRLALQFQYQSVVKEQVGQYDLACYYARIGDVPGALYWLQDAAREDGVDVDHSSQDIDLVEVRKDPRWPKLRAYLRACQRYWESSGYSETSLVLPQNAASETPMRVFIGLHGFGHNAQEFVGAERYQALADQLGAAFLGVSGTRCRGKHTFVWSEDPAQDLARIDAALKEVAERLTPAEGQLVLFGFSQGGMVSAELAGRHPQRFAGAILLSPGSVSNLPDFQLAPQDENRRQGLVAVCGAGEHPSTVNRTKRYAVLYENQGRRVYLKLYPGMNQHTLPPDFSEKFPIWCKFVLDPAARTPE